MLKSLRSRFPSPLRSSKTSLVFADTSAYIFETPVDLYIKCLYSDSWGLMNMFSQSVFSLEKKKYPKPLDLFFDVEDESPPSSDAVLVISKKAAPLFCLVAQNLPLGTLPACFCRLLIDTNDCGVMLMLWDQFLEGYAPV